MLTVFADVLENWHGGSPILCEPLNYTEPDSIYSHDLISEEPVGWYASNQSRNRASQQSSRKKAPFSSKAPLLFVLIFLPHGEVHFVQDNRVVNHLAVSVLLIVDGDAVPAGFAGITVDVQGVFHPVQGDGFIKQPVS